ncbi:Transmembrane and coiled-coil domain-containing protein 7 [Danaus plexippus plexippus]|uniref:Transmembrane and coiled-coil domain-containing protein 7 n=1 Tax=Danaus plexippus plexippus TaxID=278856 RepID=A0A212ESS0_DANPL|nr:Transmembrane and coiled-coil domain-containing protein 7 [Danaus plexippus plexippus]
MSDVNCIFKQIEKILKIDTNTEFMVAVFNEIIKCNSSLNENDIFDVLRTFLNNIIKEIDELGTIIKNNDGVSISVKNQKMLRTCYQIITSFGISSCLLPGLGISLSKRCATAKSLPTLSLKDTEKYELLVWCTDFLSRSYEVPVLKNIILTFHLSDYLAALIQLAFAPLKKPGDYSNFTMTQEMYDKLLFDKQKYIKTYEYLVNNCFQPMLMKELLVLQNITEHPPPMFAKKVISKEMSKRLTTWGGLLSLIRCFIESHEVDVGVEWKKIEMICKIVTCRHLNLSEEDYLSNIVSQLRHIYTMNNKHYLITASSCLLSLYTKYNKSTSVINLLNEVFGSFDHEALLADALPGTIILVSQQVQHNIQILQACTAITQYELPIQMSKNLYVLYLLRLNCTKTEMKLKLNDIILKIMELLNKSEIKIVIEQILFGLNNHNSHKIIAKEYESGLSVKCVTADFEYPSDEAVIYFIEMFNLITNNDVVCNIFEACLLKFIELNKENETCDKEAFLLVEDEPEVLNSVSKKCAHMLHILSEISATEKVITILKDKPLLVLDFVESLLLNNINPINDECCTIALVLLNTIVANIEKTEDIQTRLNGLMPRLKQLSGENSSYVNVLSKETLSLIEMECPKADKSAYEKAVSNIYDKLLPVRVHGVIELTKLIDRSDVETISKRHFIFCLFQEQLRHPDSYMYLASVNGIASLAMHCTAEALSILCREYLEVSPDIRNNESENQNAELRMKIGDVIVKVTRRLGEMAVVHKTILLNTMLCACKDDDPLIRTSALSNLAEIALVLNYKIGSILYELLLCVWDVINGDPALECRRAAVMVLANLIKGLGKDTLVELNDTLLPIYKTLLKLYKDDDEDSLVRLHSQIALEELNDIVKGFLTQCLPYEKEISLTTTPNNIIFK